MNTKPTRPYEIWTARDCLGRHDRRPVIVVSQEDGTDTVTVVPLTSNRESTQLPTHILLSEQGLDRTSRALCEMVKSVRRGTLIRRIGCVYKPYDRFALRHALAVHLGLREPEVPRARS